MAATDAGELPKRFNRQMVLITWVITIKLVMQDVIDHAFVLTQDVLRMSEGLLPGRMSGFLNA